MLEFSKFYDISKDDVISILFRFNTGTFITETRIICLRTSVFYLSNSEILNNWEWSTPLIRSRYWNSDFSNHAKKKHISSTYFSFFFSSNEISPCTPWHLPFPVVLFVGARNVTCLADFKAAATSQGENAPACERPKSRKFISRTLSGCATWVEYECCRMIYRDESRLMEDTR